MNWHDTQKDAETRRAIEKLCGKETVHRIGWLDVVLMLLLVACLVVLISRMTPFFVWIGGWHAPI